METNYKRKHKIFLWLNNLIDDFYGINQQIIE